VPARQISMIWKNTPNNLIRPPDVVVGSSNPPQDCSGILMNQTVFVRSNTP
jgi:hypothetical protein